MSFIIKNTGDYSPEYETIGKPLPRHDAIAKVFGETASKLVYLRVGRVLRPKRLFQSSQRNLRHFGLAAMIIA